MRLRAGVMLAALLAARATAGDEDAATRQIVQQYGACMVRFYHERLKVYVLAADGSVRPPAPLPDCVGRDGMLRMSEPIYRMVFAEALLKRDFRDGLPATLAAGRAGEPGAPDRPMLMANAMELTRRLDALGRCVAYRRPSDAYRLIRTRPASPEENAGVGALMPTLTACGLKGVLPQSVNNVRGAVAVGLYRAAMAEQGGAAVQ